MDELFTITHFDALHSTKSMRRKLRIKCPIKDDQRCHKVGLNLIKVLFNHDAEGWENNQELFDALVKISNLVSNIYCCSVAVNSHDKVVEEELLNCILYDKITFSSLSQNSRNMYTLLMNMLYIVRQEVKSKTALLMINQVITAILLRSHVNQRYRTTNLMKCFTCQKNETSCFDPVFMVPCCDLVCQYNLWQKHSIMPLSSPLLYQIQQHSKNNILLSASSIDYCMLLIYLASNEKYRKDIANYLDIDSNKDDSYYLNLPRFNVNQFMKKRKKDMTISNQTIIFHLDSVNISKNYVKLISSLKNPVKIQSFNGNNIVGIVDDINNFSNTNSNGLIPSVITVNDLKPFKDVRLVIVNTIYFDAFWIDDFMEFNNEKDQPFQSSSSPFVEYKTTLMYQKSHFVYSEDEKKQCILLPYYGNSLDHDDKNRYGMFIMFDKILSNAIIPQDEVINQYMNVLLDSKERKLVELHLPKFKQRIRIDFWNDVLLKQYPDMANNDLEKLFPFKSSVGKIIHECVIDVNEMGTQAAATTVVIIEETSALPGKAKKEETFYMKINHSFYYAIVNMTDRFRLFEGFCDTPT
jgi:serine protease inhibitor